MSANPPPPTGGDAPPKRSSDVDKNLLDELAIVAAHLYNNGFNIVWVDSEKRPIGRWTYEERLHKPSEVPRNATGVAITGGYYEDKNYVPAILDIDDPKTAIPKLSAALGDDALKVLCGAPWSFCGLTGPRPKKQVTCENGLCKMPDGSVKPADQVERGVYIVVRIPARCAPKHTTRSEEMELLVTNYQVVYGLHPSGLRYQFAKYIDGVLKPVDELPGAGVILDCDDWAKIASIFYERERKAVADEDEAKPLAEEGSRHIVDPDRLVNVLTALWSVVSPAGGHFHDWLVFGVASLARRYGIPKEDLEPVFQRVYDYAIKNGLDDEKTIREHENQWRWAYKEGAAVWGRRRFEEVMHEICQAAGKTDSECAELVDAVYEALGISPLSTACTTIETVRGDESAKRPVMWICNTPSGIVVRRREEKKRRMKTPDGEAVEDKEVLIREKKLLDASLVSVEVIHDPIVNVDYVNAKVKNCSKGTIESFSMLRAELFVERLNRKYRIITSYEWRPLLNRYETIHDIVISGFACPPPEYNLPCKVRDYFNAGLLDSVEKHDARQAFEAFYSVLSDYAPNDVWIKQVLTGYAYGAFANFMVTRKLWKQKAWLTVFEGPPNTGKSTLARLLLYSFYPNYVNSLFIPAGRQLTAARIGRSQSVLVTGLIAFDEAEVAAKREDTLNILKSYATSLVAWGTATGDSFPAYAGPVLTANAFHISDPALSDKIIPISITERVDPAKANDFNTRMPWGELIKFGTYYLRYAERNWESVRNIILAESAVAPREYFKVVMEDLGLNIELLNPDEPPVPSATTKYIINLHDEVVSTARLLTQSDAAITEVLDKLIENGMLKLARLYTRDGVEYVRIPRHEVESLGINIDQLCREMEGELVTWLRQYYKHCIVPRRQFLDIIDRYIHVYEKSDNAPDDA